MKDFTDGDKSEIARLTKERGTKLMQSEPAEGRLGMAMVRGVPILLHILECKHEPPEDTHATCHAAVIRDNGLQPLVDFDVDRKPTWDGTVQECISYLEKEIDERDQQHEAMGQFLQKMQETLMPPVDPENTN